MIQAYVFDMDGILFDTEALGIIACQHAGKQQGLDIKKETVLKTLGATAASCTLIYQTAHPSFDEDRFWADYYLFMHGYAREHGAPLKPFVKETLMALAEKKLPFAIASSSPLETIKTYLESVDLASFFPVIVSGDQGLPSKPAPDIFLEAAHSLGFRPENCLAIEDSPNGLRAARAAGFKVAMVPDLTPFSPALQEFCDFVFPDLSQVLSVLDA